MNRKFKVIVADDEKLIARNIANRIEQCGGAFEVVARAGTGAEALEAARELLPDVVFSDIKMPEMDGIELIARLRSLNPSILCVIISGYNDFEYTRAAIRNNAVDYLLKPVNPEELQALLGRLEATLLAREQRVVPRRETSPAALVESVMIYLRENYDKPIDFSAIADMQAISASYLTRLFHDRAGTSPSKYLADYRMQQARKLLADSTLSVKEIAARVGYPDPFHFSKSFKNLVGMSPAQYREERAAAPGRGTPAEEDDDEPTR